MSEYDSDQIAAVPGATVHARDDTLIPFEHGQFSAACIPKAELVEMKVGGHLALLLDANFDARTRVLEFPGPQPPPMIHPRPGGPGVKVFSSSRRPGSASPRAQRGHITL